MGEVKRAVRRTDEAVRTIRVSAGSPPGWLTAAIALGAALSCLEVVAPVHFENLAVRSASEATVTLFALTGLALLFRRYVQTRRRRDLAPLAAVAAASLVDLTLFTFPALTGQHALQINAGARLLGLLLACSAMVSLAAVILFRRRGDTDSILVVCAAILLAAACVQYLVEPAIESDWVTPLNGVRLIAYGLLLAVAIRVHLHARDEAARAALLAERERIARDLHDGLAQDLAFIAAYGSRLDAELGGDHPLVIAARRAVQTSRGAIQDLSASSAASTGEALRTVARELARLFGVEVNVFVRGSGSREPTLQVREELVRITREAIVNAAKHGRAQLIEVELDLRGRQLALRIGDDGAGFDEDAVRTSNGSGLGLPTMKARAQAVGGQLLTRRRPQGGTEVELLIS